MIIFCLPIPYSILYKINIYDDLPEDFSVSMVSPMRPIIPENTHRIIQ